MVFRLIPYNSNTLRKAKMLPLRRRKTIMLQPDFKEFSRLAREATLVPVVKTVTADLLTPVSAFLAVAANEPHSFLLESVERGEQIGRYTFLGARPYMRSGPQGDEITIERGKTPRAPHRRCLRHSSRNCCARIARAPPRTAAIHFRSGRIFCL